MELLGRAEPWNLDEAVEAGWELLQKISIMRGALAPHRSEDGTFAFTRTYLVCSDSSRHFE